MKFLKYLIVGVVFGIVLTKSEVISWFRIFEMFRFESFHMYGVIGSAVVIGILGIAFIKRTGLTDITGDRIVPTVKEKTYVGSILGGTIFGIGWAMTGACPGPLFILLGNGYMVVGVVILSALLGTYVYGLIRKWLPH